MLGSQESAFESVFASHHGALVRRATGMTRDPEVAEDLVQEAFVRLAREVELGRTPEYPKAWLHHVVQNLVRSWGRHRSVVDRFDAAYVPPPAIDGPEAAVLWAERARSIQDVLAGLSAVERSSLLLAAEGYSGREIAKRLGRTPEATRTLMCRARSKVRAKLAAAEPSEESR
jgi:RNA polymerase sigma factor (sigma-70 family)